MPDSPPSEPAHSEPVWPPPPIVEPPVAVAPRFLFGSRAWDIMCGVIIGFVCVTCVGEAFFMVALAVMLIGLPIATQWLLWGTGYAVSVALFFRTRRQLPTLAWSILAGATFTSTGMFFMLKDMIGD